MGGLFKGRHFEKAVILQAVRWYLSCALSYRDVEELLAERGMSVDHSTIARWVRKYAPLLEKSFRGTKRKLGDSWRLAEHVHQGPRTVEVSLPCGRYLR